MQKFVNVKYFALDEYNYLENGTILVDSEQQEPIKQRFVGEGEFSYAQTVYSLDEAKRRVVKALDNYTTVRVIPQFLAKFNEELNDIQTELENIKGTILYILKKHNVTGITIDDVSYKVILYALGRYDSEQAEQELSQLNLDEDTKKLVIEKLGRAAFIAKLIMAKEEIWEAEEQIEKQIESADFETFTSTDYFKLLESKVEEILQKYNLVS